MSQLDRRPMAVVSALAVAGAVVAGMLGVIGGTSTGLVKTVQCPSGYVLNPQNTQQCVPAADPFGGKGMPAGVPG
jgi:hypothetical protein